MFFINSKLIRLRCYLCKKLLKGIIKRISEVKSRISIEDDLDLVFDERKIMKKYFPERNFNRFVKAMKKAVVFERKTMKKKRPIQVCEISK